MIRTLNRFWSDESGPELVEWAVVTIILLVAAVVLYLAVGRALGGIICAVQCWLNAVKKSDSANMQTTDKNLCDTKDQNSCTND